MPRANQNHYVYPEEQEDDYLKPIDVYPAAAADEDIYLDVKSGQDGKDQVMKSLNQDSESPLSLKHYVRRTASERQLLFFSTAPKRA